jgi:hypothetical protein
MTSEEIGIRLSELIAAKAKEIGGQILSAVDSIVEKKDTASCSFHSPTFLFETEHGEKPQLIGGHVNLSISVPLDIILTQEEMEEIFDD